MNALETVKNVLNDSLDINPEDITPDTTFESLEIDSLDMTELVCSLEDEIDAELTDLESLKTIGDLVNKIESL